MGRARWRRAFASAFAVALATTAVACSDDDSSTDATATVPATPDPVTGSSVVDPAGDGALTVGVLLPLTGPGSEIGTVMRDAVVQARDEAKAAGVQFRDVELVIVDEATVQGAITPTLTGIFTEEVDAVIGPASSLLAERLLPVTINAGVFTCSPTASALSLDDIPDPGPLFVRTIPSDSMQATALAMELDSTGVDVVLAYVDDSYGRPFMELVKAELIRLGASSVEAFEFDPLESDYDSRSRPRSSARAAPRSASSATPSRTSAGPVARRADHPRTPHLDLDERCDARAGHCERSYRRLAGSPILELMAGVSPRSTVPRRRPSPRVSRPSDGGRFFAANAYDCMNVIALAADQASFINGRDMAEQVVQLTNGGTQCASFIACINQLRNERAIDYDGPSGSLDIGPDGDPTVGVFDVYRFDERGLDVTAADQRVTVDS
jgi:branched-chain amino acid transport system substrate-binding protein